MPAAVRKSKAEEKETMQPEETLEGDDGSEEVSPVRFRVSSFGADFDVDGTVRRLQNGSIYSPDFQRLYVWTQKQASLFIESLLLGLPVPGVFLAKTPDSPNMQVIDGLQRLKTLQYFFEGEFPLPSGKTKSFTLEGVVDPFAGRTYEGLDSDERTRLGFSLIHATIVRQDSPDENPQSSVFHIFQRLNTGGTKLSSQEIRHGLYHGTYSLLLEKENARFTDWHKVFSKRKIFVPDKRMRDQELILRFSALLYGWESYRVPMVDFLNVFMAKNKNLEKYKEQQLVQPFEETIRLLKTCAGVDVFRFIRRPFNTALFDALAVGLSLTLSEKGKNLNIEKIKLTAETLKKDRNFEALCSGGTTDERKIKNRISMAKEAFCRK